MLNENVVKLLESGMWDLATCADGEPNVVPVAFKDVTPDGKLVVNDQCIDPMPVITGAAEYPQNISEAIKAAGASMIELDALSLAVKAGSAKAVNVVLIGAMASHMQLSYETWTNAIRNTVPEKFLDMNLEAFRLGYEHEKSC